MNYKCIDLKYAKLHLIKTKKFRCLSVENSDITGRITKMIFEEI